MTRYFDDLAIGQILPVGSWTLDEGAMIDFATVWDPQPFHVDPVAAADSMFASLTASSLYVFAICTRLFFDMADPLAIAAMLGKDEIRLPAPARAGRTLRYTTEVAELTPSRTKPDRGIVVVADEVSDDQETVIMTQRVSLMLRRRSG